MSLHVGSAYSLPSKHIFRFFRFLELVLDALLLYHDLIGIHLIIE